MTGWEIAIIAAATIAGPILAVQADPQRKRRYAASTLSLDSGERLFPKGGD